MNSTDYEKFRNDRQELIQFIEHAKPLFSQLKDSDGIRSLDQLKLTMESESFKVLVLGEFDRGKSTLINALLGEEVLPADNSPTTAIITEVKWGAQKFARLHFRNLLPDPLPDLEPAVTEHIQRAESGAIPPFQISIEHLEKYLVIPKNDPEASVSESPFERVEVFWPSELCRNGVEFIDSPGLNDHPLRTEETKKYLNEADAVIFVMALDKLAGKWETEFLDRFRPGTRHEYNLIVCNCWEELNDYDMEDMRRYIFNEYRLADKTKFGQSGIFFISAKKALDGKREGNQQKLEHSGFPVLEKQLTRFLAEDRGSVKLIGGAKGLIKLLDNAVDSLIPSELKALSDDTESQRNRYEEAKSLLVIVDRDCKRIVSKAEQSCSDLRDEVFDSAHRRFRRCAERMPKAARDYISKNQDIVSRLLKQDSGTRNVAVEIQRRLARQIEEDEKEWYRKKLQPLCEKWKSTLRADLQLDCDDVRTNLARIRAVMTDMTESGDTLLPPAEGVIVPAENLKPVLPAQSWENKPPVVFEFSYVFDHLEPEINTTLSNIVFNFFNLMSSVMRLFGIQLENRLADKGSAGVNIASNIGNDMADQLLDQSNALAVLQIK